MSDLFTVRSISYMDDGANQVLPADDADVRKWALEQGYALVPVDPTKEMIDAAINADADCFPIEHIYKAMITAAQEGSE